MSEDKKKYYPEVDTKVDFPKIEEEVLRYWAENNIFEESVSFRPSGEKGSNEYVFYDGPPFANGLPHYGHLLTGYVKDIIPRYETMRGKRVERRFGWDCHGLPAELDAEKFLGFSGRDKIINYGIDKFNDTCCQRVLMYTNEWKTTVNRQARWVDFANDYKTMDISYMESILWAFKTLYDKGLMYEGFKVMPYSWAAETPVSNFETRLDNSYREKEDPAVTVMFTLEPISGDEKPLKILVWTTTPWTLPSNLALAVGSEIDYDIYEEEGTRYIIGSAVVNKYKKELSQARKIGSIKGKELEGRKYIPIFDYYKDLPGAFRVITADYVSTEEGTGTVHIAPGFGEDDLNAATASGVPVVCPVDSKGCFTQPIEPFVGMQVFETNKPIIKILKERGILVKQEQYKHNYPHCWRTDTPLIYKAINGWFLKVTEIKDRMVELNQNIDWIPNHIKDGAFGKWLENARDWSISRNRFWGSPIPVWKSDDPRYPRIDVYGSLDELERDFGVRPNNLHRPYIDQLTRPNPDDPTGKSMMRRVEDVFDCWFESGSMPFAQVHYPFENKEWFEDHFPADFIVEYIAQTRGWFYTMMVMATALFDRHPFKRCLCHGVVLDENNQKLSKRLRNYPSPEEVFETLGSDALRWFLISSSILKGGNLSIDREGKEIAKASRKVLIPLWNAYNFFCLYANAEGIKAKEIDHSPDVLDTYILSKTRELIEKLTKFMDDSSIPEACSEITEFLDILNNWYIRRSRARFWNGHNEDALNAFNTLYTVLCLVTKSVAPLLPLISENIYRGLTGEKSVHLSDWPDVSKIAIDEDLISNMDMVRSICSTAKAVREEHRLRNRLPLASMTIAGQRTFCLSDYIPIIADEVNVKEVFLSNNISEFADTFLYVKTPLVGKRLGKYMKDILAASKTGDWGKNPDGTLSIAGQTLLAEEFELRLVLKESKVGMALPDNTAVIVLDTKIYPNLEREGIARDFVRMVQNLRKELNFDVSDRIDLIYHSDNETILQSLEEYKDYIKDQVLALSFNINSEEEKMKHEELGDGKIDFSISKH